MRFKKGFVIRMKVSTSLNIFGAFSEKPYTELIQMGVEAGFKCFDLNVADYKRKGDNFYNTENWRDEMKKIKEFADSTGVEFFQSHADISSSDFDDETNDYNMRKSIEAAALVGVKWTVMHPYDIGKTDEERARINIEKLRPYVEYAKNLGVGIAVENTPRQLYWYDEHHLGYFYHAEHLIPIVDTLNNEFGNVGICWDTGHANLAMESQYDDLIKVGKRLKVLHVADNSCQTDDHLPPFLGYTNFKEIMKALKEIGYEGTFNFETHNFCNKMPEVLVIDAAKMLYKIGDYIVNNY